MRERTQDCSIPFHFPGEMERQPFHSAGRIAALWHRCGPHRLCETPRQKLSRKVTLHKSQRRERCVPTSSSRESVPSRGIHRVIQTTEIISGANNPQVFPAPVADPHAGETWSTSCTHWLPGARTRLDKLQPSRTSSAHLVQGIPHRSWLNYP